MENLDWKVWHLLHSGCLHGWKFPSHAACHIGVQFEDFFSKADCRFTDGFGIRCSTNLQVYYWSGRCLAGTPMFVKHLPMSRTFWCFYFPWILQHILLFCDESSNNGIKEEFCASWRKLPVVGIVVSYLGLPGVLTLILCMVSWLEMFEQSGAACFW